MFIIAVIPFLLGTMLPNIHEKIFMPKYTFQVQIETSLFNTTKNYWESGAGLSFNLKCQLQIKNNGLKCNIKNNIFYTPGTNPDLVYVKPTKEYEFNEIYTPSSFIHEQTYVIITFNKKGPFKYDIEGDVANKSTLLEMFQMIGDQLTIGTDIKVKGFEFNASEHFATGMCLTLYKISQNKESFRKEYELYALFESNTLKLKHKALHINKYRHVDKCYPSRNYMLGMKLWTDFILPNVIVKLNKSESLMSLAKHNFYTTTINIFELYDHANNTVGFVQETIKVNLTSINL